jgi:hypothetical protein
MVGKKAAMRFRQAIPGGETKAGHPGDKGTMEHSGHQIRTTDEQRPLRGKQEVKNDQWFGIGL